MNRLTRYYPITNGTVATGNANFIKADVHYNKGGINYFTYKQEQRGYYISVSPVERKRGMESYVAFSGFKTCILPVERQSKKREEEARNNFRENILQTIYKMFPNIAINEDFTEREVR